ncbi:MAG: outer membrane beta-barrel protein [Saprospiraceae bacterium]|nr:outer membrane beta-barrel protein [Saprospiraceae bacterium]
MNMKNLQSIFLFIFFLISYSLTGQEQITMASISKGISAGVHLAYISHENDSYHPEAETGLGYGIIAQYGINHSIAVAFSYQHYSIESKSGNTLVKRYPLFEYDFIGKYIFGSSTSQLRPYLQAGFNFTNTEEGYYYPELGTFLDVYTTEEYYAKSFLAGAGLSYYFTPHISADLNLIVHAGQFTKTYVTSNYTPTETIRIKSDLFNVNGQVGVQYHF